MITKSGGVQYVRSSEVLAEILGHTNFVAGLSKGSCLLVARVTSHLNRPTKELGVGLSVDRTGRHDRGERC